MVSRTDPPCSATCATGATDYSTRTSEDTYPAAVNETDLTLPDGRTLHVYDSGDLGGPTVLWHAGTPNIGTPPRPLFGTGDRLGVRWVGYDRPGYGGSTPNPGRDVASAASDVTAIADALRLDRFAVLGSSGGGPHALACAALLGNRVFAAVSAAGMAPFALVSAQGLDWFAGMSAASVASLGAATRGRAEKERFEASGEKPEMELTDADMAALSGEWGWFGEVVRPAMAAGPGPVIDDDLANAGPWGFDPADIDVPVLFLHGGEDRVVPCAHSEWLANRCPDSELRIRPTDGHISVLAGGASALEWLVGHA